MITMWRAGSTLDQIGEHFRITRQRVSQILIANGYSPAERVAEQRATRRVQNEDYYRRRADMVSQRVEHRDEACDGMLVLARELGVSPATLGQYVARSGTYAKRNPDKQAPRYGTGALPPRKSEQGAEIAARAERIAAPWSVMHICSIAARRRSSRPPVGDTA